MTKQLKVDNIVDTAGTGKPNFPVSPTSGGAALSTLNTHSYTSSATEPSSPKNGAIWWDSANSKVYVYANGEFKEITLNTDYPSAYSSGNAWSGDRAIVFGAATDTIQYYDITSPGNATDFGDLSEAVDYLGAAGSSTRAIRACGTTYPGNSRRNTLEYVTPSTTGNATDFGDSTSVRNALACCSNGTRMLTGGGYNGGSYINTVDYITVDTTGNATDFGDLSGTGQNMNGGAGEDATRAVFGGGIGGTTNTIDYFTFATPGNATDFGDLLATSYRNAACSDATRVYFTGNGNSIQYITTQTTGNATDHGDLTQSFTYHGCCENATIGTVMNPTNNDVSIEYFTMSTSGDATDFGDLTSALSAPAATSGNPS